MVDRTGEELSKEYNALLTETEKTLFLAGLSDGPNGEFYALADYERELFKRRMTTTLEVGQTTAAFSCQK